MQIVFARFLYLNLSLNLRPCLLGGRENLRGKKKIRKRKNKKIEYGTRDSHVSSKGAAPRWGRGSGDEQHAREQQARN